MQNYPYPADFQPGWFAKEGIDLIAAAYADYFTTVHGTNTRSWPASARKEYGHYAPLHLPASYTLLGRVFNGVDRSPAGFWASDDAGFLNLVFRGTEGIPEWLEDAVLLQAPVSTTIPGAVGYGEMGFLAAYQGLCDSEGNEISLTAQYEDYLDRGLGDSGIFVLGHSLGGALSMFAATELSTRESPPEIWVYTTGCPRAGDPEFAAALDANVAKNFRVQGAWDPIPDLPPVMIAPNGEQSMYDHAGAACPVYNSALEFLRAIALGKPLYGHHLSTYREGLRNLAQSGVLPRAATKGARA